MIEILMFIVFVIIPPIAVYFHKKDIGIAVFGFIVCLLGFLKVTGRF